MTESDRIINLELSMDKLAELVAQTTLSVQSLSEEMKEFKAEAERDRKEFKADADRDRKHADKQWEEFKAEAERDRKEFKNEMNKKWSELANSMGRIVEYLIVPNIDFLTSKFFNNEAYSLYHDIYKKSEGGTGKQFDGILISETKFF
jgi:hypothetical protein